MGTTLACVCDRYFSTNVLSVLEKLRCEEDVLAKLQYREIDPLKLRCEEIGLVMVHCAVNALGPHALARVVAFSLC